MNLFRIPLTGAAIAITALLGACSSLPRNVGPVEPATLIPVTWPSDAYSTPAATELVSKPASTSAWRDYFSDPQLLALIETALANNRDLRVAVARVNEARAAYGIQRSEQFPALAASASGARSRVPGDLNISGQSVVGAEYEAHVGMGSWEMDFWGRVRNLKSAALEQYLASDEARRATELALIGEVANTWLQLREFDERVALAAESVRSREESFRIYTRRADVGSSSRLELTQVETLLLQARQLRAQLAQGRAVQAHRLQLLLGASTELPSTAGTGLRDERVFAHLDPGLPADLLINRPDIIAAEHQLLAARANIGAARAAFFPRITLTGSLGSASAELDGLFESGSRAWSFLPTISLPIFDGGRRRSNLDLAEARRDISIANYEKTVQSAFRDVADALSAREWLARQVDIQHQYVSTQTERARLATLRHDAGSTTFLEVLDAQRSLLDAQQAWVQARRAHLSSQVGLYTALGGGPAIAVATLSSSRIQ